MRAVIVPFIALIGLIGLAAPTHALNPAVPVMSQGRRPAGDNRGPGNALRRRNEKGKGVARQRWGLAGPMRFQGAR